MSENTAFVLIHGLGQTSSSWDAVISFLPPNIQLFCPDLCLLTGKSEATYENLYRAFENYCMSISDKINLCGISLGAVLVLNYAVDHPKEVKSLVLIAPQYKIPRFLFGLQNVLFHFMSPKSFCVGFNKEQMICLTSSMRELDFSRVLSNIACPVIVVCGNNDKANRKAAKEMISLIPAARLHFIRDAGHEVNIDTPKELSDVLKFFWYE